MTNEQKAIHSLRASMKTLGMVLNNKPSPTKRDKMLIGIIHDALDKTEEFNNLKEQQNGN